MVNNPTDSPCFCSKCNYSNSVCDNFHSNPKQFWRWVNSTRGYRSPIPLVSHAGVTVTDDHKKADVFNNYFCSVFTKEDTTNLSTLQSISSHPTIIDHILISSTDVFNCNSPRRHQ